MRLKFETDGVTYNLGVIDNKQTGSNTPINNEELEVEILDYNEVAFDFIIMTKNITKKMAYARYYKKGQRQK